MLIALIILGTTLVRSDQGLSGDVVPAIGRRIKVVKPIAPAVQPKYRVTVQSKPKFPQQKRPAVSQPASERGLSVTVQPERMEFAGNGPLAFEVVLKNVSQQPFLLYGAEVLGRKAKLVIANRKTAAQWEPGLPAAGKDVAAVELAPGKTLTYSLVVEGVFAFPRPLPRPLPRPIPRPFPKRQKIQAAAGAAVQIDRRRPVFIGPVMPCGMGPCRVRLLLEFNTDPRRRYKIPQWTGKIATGTVGFEVGRPQPIQPPIVGPPFGGPITKQQAVKLATPVAERVLDSNYKPVEPVRPPHKGAWIVQPEKTARVKQRKGGGWTVNWTHVPMGKGFAYNVTIAVGSTGAVSVQEVFTGYSPR
jgi:hypothetical protein